MAKKVFYFVFTFTGWYILSFMIYWPILDSTRFDSFAYIMIYSGIQAAAVFAVNHLLRSKEARKSVVSGVLFVAILVVIGFFLRGCGVPPGLPFPLSLMSGC